jgi:histidinol-phosphate aminotransferase
MRVALPQTLSRRNFMRTLGAASFAATSLPAFATSSAMGMPGRMPTKADATKIMELPPEEMVVLSSNENPLGPSQAALAALATTAALGGRYHGEETMATVKVFNEMNGLPRGYSALFPGSSGALDLALMSNIGPDRPLVVCDPSYEQSHYAAQLMKAPLLKVKLTASYAHDVRAMVAATPNAGAYFIVNPNNPTGTITPRADILWLLKNKPKGSVVVVDEAYIHFANEDSVIDRVAAGDDLVVLRTFSKIYGMAGLRAGFAAARPDLMMRFTTVAPSARSLASIAITTAAAARASLQDLELVPLRKKINEDVRAETFAFLTKRGYKFVPGSQANMFMVDVHRSGDDFQSAMMDAGVAVGRTWDAMPHHVRVTVGTRDEMARFQSAFVRCMDVAPGAANGASLRRMDLGRGPSELGRG